MSESRNVQAAPAASPATKAYRGLPLEGCLARWYAKNTARSMDEFRRAAEMVAAQSPAGGSILEVAAGPGYLCVELAKIGGRRITGLDISHSFVAMATENAKQAGVAVDFRHGDASAMPLADNSFDFIVCRAAFKNFSRRLKCAEKKA